MKLKHFAYITSFVLGLSLADYVYETYHSSKKSEESLNTANIATAIRPQKDIVSNNAYALNNSMSRINKDKDLQARLSGKKSEGTLLETNVLSELRGERYDGTYTQLCMIINDDEHNWLFNNSKESELSRNIQNSTALQNWYIIGAMLKDSIIDFNSSPWNEIKFNKKKHTEYLPLKKLLNNMEKIYYDTIKYEDTTSIMKMAELYNLIEQYICSEREETPNSEGLLYLTNGNSGDCNDITPAYFALLGYYGYKVEMKTAHAYNGKRSTLHTWLQVNHNGTKFDLDPTWHPVFIPLKPRLGEKD